MPRRGLPQLPRGRAPAMTIGPAIDRETEERFEGTGILLLSYKAALIENDSVLTLTAQIRGRCDV